VRLLLPVALSIFDVAFRLNQTTSACDYIWPTARRLQAVKRLESERVSESGASVWYGKQWRRFELRAFIMCHLMWRPNERSPAPIVLDGGARVSANIVRRAEPRAAARRRPATTSARSSPSRVPSSRALRDRQPQVRPPTMALWRRAATGRRQAGRLVTSPSSLHRHHYHRLSAALSAPERQAETGPRTPPFAGKTNSASATHTIGYRLPAPMTKPSQARRRLTSRM
jgi:hypothetical protein